MKKQLIESFIKNSEALGFTTAEMVDYLTKRGAGND
jgi:GntR family transcriptional regulator